MATAIAEAKTIECTLTPRETLAAVEEFGISLYPPRRGGGGGWMAGYKCESGYLWGHGDTLTAAVEELLRKIGGENG